jgi:mannosyltransferase OCH1-like enzyme
VHLFWTPPQGHCPAPPENIARHISEWQRLHPAYLVHVWSLDEIRALADQIKDIPVWESVHACRFEAMQSDIARLAILHELGGFYSDLKNLPLQPFLDHLVDCKSAVVPEHQPTIEHYQRRPSNSFLAAPPRHDFIRMYLDLACTNVANRLAGSVIDVTGNSVLQLAMEQFRSFWRRDLYFVPSVVVWGPKGGSGGWMRRTSASYNKQDLTAHWSIRQKHEPMYVG